MLVRRVPAAMRQRLIALTAILAAALVAGHDASRAAGDGPCSSAPSRGNLYVQMAVGGVPRSAIVHVPRHARRGARLPLVLAFHGAGRTGSFMASYSTLESLSDSQGFISVFPSAARPHRYWALAEEDPGGPQDLAFIEQLLDRAEAMTCVDASRVYATGISNGGGMTARLGCEMSSRLAAIAPVSGGYSSLDPCHPSRPVSVLEIHGTADKVVPYAGKPPGGRGSVGGFLGQWTALDGCRGSPTRRGYGPSSMIFSWRHCADGTEVEHIKIYGGGHAWPGAEPPDRAPTAPISAARAVWNFFRGHSLSGAAG
jgi:polyhydroxybutyrate depolymerase